MKTACFYWFPFDVAVTEYADCDGTQCDYCKELNAWLEDSK